MDENCETKTSSHASLSICSTITNTKDDGSSKSIAHLLNGAKSPWFSLWIANIVQFFIGIQFSIFFTSLWPFLLSIDNTVTLDMFGYVVAAYSIGQALSSPIFGYWNQRTKSTKWPVIVGIAVTVVGNLLYALLPTIAIASDVKWLMMISRLIVGLGSELPRIYIPYFILHTGIVGVLRAYVAMASIPADRVKATALNIALFVVGLSLGPAIQAAFRPIGANGYLLANRLLHISMYTAPAYAMIVGCVVCAIIVWVAFVDDSCTAIIDDQQRKDCNVILPKFDRKAAAVCIFVWFVHQSISTNLEVIDAPYTMAMYNWNDEQVILYNGIIVFVAASVNLFIYLLHALTRLKTVDCRKLILIGIVSFIGYHILTIPWPFWSTSLDCFSVDGNVTISNHPLYEWCAYTKRVPLVAFIIAYVVFLGMAFPLISSPLSTLYSNVLGPRKQGNMQGIFALFGSIARCLAPLFATHLFQRVGPTWPWIFEIVLLLFAALLIIVFYNRLVSLKLISDIKAGDVIQYKNGYLYRF